ncbi:MAG: JmjC domain-containing protein [Burkholderiales bacterium]|nr:cupin domain-containing protein [Burkholderiales bacterium]MDQ3196384.1 cupin domain-containing protein [Pseudomonadota bacterium]
MKDTLLGKLSTRKFLREHWQKKPLLVRHAIPDLAERLKGIDRHVLMELSARDDLESRLVLRERGRWQLRRGPFDKRDFRRLPPGGWTLLINGLDRVLPQASSLRLEFGFLPTARLDDVMASYASDGGGVGPHFDSYDVFLLQGPGMRRWRISAQQDLSLRNELPLKILKNFRSEQESLLDCGDMLYLPPHYAHDGIAVDECITYSIGFYAPSAAEIGVGFLDFLRDRLEFAGMYQDADLKPQRHPALISRDMQRRISAMLETISWGSDDILAFIGQFLTEPGNDVFFEAPLRPMPSKRWAAAIRQHGIHLDLKTRMLFDADALYINGERGKPGFGFAALRQLADRRELAPPLILERDGEALLYQWYRAGYIHAGRI